MLLLDAVVLGDEPEAWTEVGFEVTDDGVALGSSRVVCTGDGEPPRWTLWSDGDLPADIDGIPTRAAAGEPEAPDHGSHRLGTVTIDHVVVRSPHLDRSTAAFEALGVRCRRVRDTGTAERPMQQRFFRLGPVIVEMVGTPGAENDGPASIWGLALTVEDLDAAVAVLGERCGGAKDAVQPGRRIATLRTRDAGISVPVALMSPEG